MIRQKLKPSYEIDFFKEANRLKLKELKLNENPLKIFGFMEFTKFETNDKEKFIYFDKRSFNNDSLKVQYNSYS